MSTQNKKGISALTATIAASFFAAAITLGFAMSIYQGTLGNADPARGELNEMLIMLTIHVHKVFRTMMILNRVLAGQMMVEKSLSVRQMIKVFVMETQPHNPIIWPVNP